MTDDPKDESSELDWTLAVGEGLLTPDPGPINPSGLKPPVIPGYAVLHELGAGGMGVVWEAEQLNPRRRVAIKVIRGGSFVDETHVRMFQREADTLARLKHPDIGGIYEAGRTQDGHHFFAMELVRGKTLAAFLRDRLPSWELNPEEVRFRVQLLQRLASAVHYAHQRGVIHRDLKPSNILVGDGEAAATETGHAQKGDLAARLDLKILDFGLARITDTDVAASMVSEVGMVKGTLAYMSPEQARGNPDDIDVRSDVFSLGVIFYEMLTGRLPRKLPTASMLAALKVITEDKPQSLLESFRGPRGLDRDVATICNKALELDSEDRYAGAAALAEDLGRWLSNQPIQARPPTTLYQMRKLVARNKATSAFVSALLLLLVGLAVTMSVLRGIAEESRQEAQAAVERLEVARTELETVADFQARMLSDLNAETLGRNLFENLSSQLNTALEGEPNRQAALASFGESLKRVNPTDIALGVLDEDILTRAEKAVETEFADQPEVRGRLEHSLGRTAFELGLYERGETMLRRALVTFEQTGADSNAIPVQSDLALLEIYVGNWDEAAGILKQAREEGHRLLGPEHPNMIQLYVNEALLYREQGNWQVADSLYTDLVALCTRVYGAESEETVTAREARAFTWSNLERLEEAEAEYAAIMPLAHRLWGSDDTQTLTFEHNAAINYVRMERYDEALEIYRRGIEAGRRIQGSDHSETLVAIVNLGRLYSRLGRYPEAEEQGREALDIATRAVAPQSVDMAMASAVLGESLNGQGRHAEAEPHLKRAYDIFAMTFGPESGGAKVMARMIVAGMESRGTAADLELWRQRASEEPEGSEP